MDGMQTKERLNNSLKVVVLWKSVFLKRERGGHEKSTVFWELVNLVR